MAYEVDEYTVSLLHFDDGIKDETGRVWAANGGAETSNTQSKVGNAALELKSSQYIQTPATVDFEFGSGDFTIDWWMYKKSGSCGVFCYNTAIAVQPILLYATDTFLGVYMDSGAGSWDVVSNRTISSITLDTWVHYAFVRKGSTFYTFKDGILTDSFTSNLPLGKASTPFAIGYYAAAGYFNGYIDEFRVSKGIARWTSDFDPSNDDILAPTNLTANASDSKVTLSWTAATGAIGYNVKQSTTAGGPYSTISSNVTGTSYVDSTVTNGTTYYYVVTAITADGESANSNEVSATPTADGNPGTGDQAILRVTMIDSSEREYQLPITEINGFANWHVNHTSTDTASYILNKKVGSQNSKEYLAFDKIISLEVIPVA